MEPKRKQQHFVPEFLLRHFATGGNDRLYAYDKWNDRVFATTPEKAAKENGFYDFEINGVEVSLEQPLDTLEANAAPIILNLLKTRDLLGLSTQDKTTLALFCAAQMLRDKGARAMHLDMRDKMRERLKEMGADPKKVKGFEDPDDEEIRRTSIIQLAEAPKLLPYFLNYKHWALLLAPDGSNLYTSDSPLTFHNDNEFGFFGNLGLAVKGIQISLPLSARINLWITCDSIESEMRMRYQEAALAGVSIHKPAMVEIRRMLAGFSGKECFLMRSENVIRFNSLQVSKAERFLYSSTDDFSLARKMLKKNPDLKRGHRWTMD